jgi:hypothetical protein
MVQSSRLPEVRIVVYLSFLLKKTVAAYIKKTSLDAKIRNAEKSGGRDSLTTWLSH